MVIKVLIMIQPSNLFSRPLADGNSAQTTSHFQTGDSSENPEEISIELKALIVNERRVMTHLSAHSRIGGECYTKTIDLYQGA